MPAPSWPAPASAFQSAARPPISTPPLRSPGQSEDRWIEVTVLRAMAEQASGDRRTELFTRALEVAENAGLRPEADRARRALAGGDEGALERPRTAERAQAGARVTT
jgi:hypothetical protein